jgi:hypothetical protein
MPYNKNNSFEIASQKDIILALIVKTAHKRIEAKFLKLMHYTAHHKFTRLQFAVSFFSQ